MENRSPCPAIVVIAASAGGVRALMKVVTALPPTFPVPIVIVQHRPVTPESQLVAILQRCTALTVTDARSGELVEGGTIYVARPDRHLMMTAMQRFVYVDGRRIRYVRSSANPLLESVAVVFGAGAIAVVLTGCGNDGTDGVQAIKAHGGTVIAQDRSTSEQFGMPGSAIASGSVDRVLALDDIAPALVELAAWRQTLRTGQGDRLMMS